MRRARVLLGAVCAALLLGRSPADCDAPAAQQAPPAPIKFEAPASGQLSQQRQVAQVGQLLLSGAQQLASSPLANLSSRYASNVLDVLKDVKKSIAGQVVGATGYQLLPAAESPPDDAKRAAPTAAASAELPKSLGAEPSGAHAIAAASNSSQSQSFREQGEQLRQEIAQRAAQLQSMIASSMGALKTNGDLIVRRILVQMNARLDSARAKADRIISEPTNNEIAVKALATINNTLTQLNSIINNLVGRLDITGAAAIQSNSIAQRSGQTGSGGGSGSEQPSKLQLNLAQIRHQFSSAISAVQKQQQQQQQQLSGQRLK